MKVVTLRLRSDRTIYCGRRFGDAPDTGSDNEVLVNGKPLDWERTLIISNHSPTGPNWGYGGSGPAQLAFAILYDFTKRDELLTSTYYMAFKQRFVCGWPDSWWISGETIRKWLREEVTRGL
jgi:hypothetical protein